MIKPVMFGKFCLLERISVGGMAEVFRAKSMDSPNFDKFLALKRILPNLAEDDEFIEMFIDEAKIAVQLVHQNICQIYELGCLDDHHFIVMEFISGRDILSILNKLRKERRIMSVGMAAYLCQQMALGLEGAHSKPGADGKPMNVIHRDVSPQNILVSYTGEVKIIDFGIAKAATRSNHTQVGVLKGKFGYMSPEQVRGLHIDRRSDIFALGTVLHEMLTCRRLFHGNSDFETLEKVREADVEAPSTFNPQIPAEIDRIVLKALAGDPEQRYQTCAELADDLQNFLRGLRPPYTGRTLEDWMQRTFQDKIKEEIGKRKAFAQFKSAEDVHAYNAELAAQVADALNKSGGTPSISLLGDTSAPLDAADEDNGATQVWSGDLPGSGHEHDPAPAPNADDGFANESTRIMPGGVDMVDVPAAPPAPTPQPAGRAGRRGAPPLPQPPQPVHTPYNPYGHNPNPSPFAGGRATSTMASLPTVGNTQRRNAQGGSVLPLVLVVGLLLVAFAMVGVFGWVLLGDKGEASASRGAMSITSAPVTDVEVWINGELKAPKTPFELPSLDDGVYLIELKHPDFKPLKRAVKIQNGQKATVALTLEPKPTGEGTVELSLAPPDATVFVDGVKVEGNGAKRTLTLDDAKPHTLEVLADKRFVHTQKLELDDGEKRKVVVDLKPALGKIAIDASPSGAIALNGKASGEAPKTLTGLDPFTLYTVEITHKGHHPWRRQVLFHRSLQKTYSAKLVPSDKGAPPDRAMRVGKVTVKSPKAWWAIVVNGWSSGRTVPRGGELTLTLPAGEQKLSFVRGDTSIDRTITVLEGQTASVTLDEAPTW